MSDFRFSCNHSMRERPLERHGELDSDDYVRDPLISTERDGYFAADSPPGKRLGRICV